MSIVDSIVVLAKSTCIIWFLLGAISFDAGLTKIEIFVSAAISKSLISTIPVEQSTVPQFLLSKISTSSALRE